MGILDRFKKKETPEKSQLKTEEKVNVAKETKPVVKEVKKEEKAQTKSVKKDQDGKRVKGGSPRADQILIKPLVTEKASDLGVMGKYIFAVDPKMNKVEVKKAVRSIYNVEPVRINISNFSGKQVRYGRIKGKTKSWKKAVVTLKPGDKIEVYEGV